MSGSLSPWILDYIAQIADTYGENISDAPSYSKAKKVQITKFFTYGGSENDDTHIWAEASDKIHLIPLKITKEAISEYRKSCAGQSLTRHVGAIVSIKNFKIMSTPVPATPGQFTAHPGLALECAHISVLGSSTESTFGNPEPITNVRDIRSWSDCLNHGTAGNFLRLRDLRQRNPRVALDIVEVQVQPSILRPMDACSVSDNVDDNVLYAHITRHSFGNYNINAYKAHWQIVSKNADYLRYSPNGDTSDKCETDKDKGQGENGEVDEHLQESSRSSTGSPISGWEPSPEITRDEGNVAYAAEGSSIPSPTPSQHRPTATPVTPVELLSSYPSVKETPLESDTKTSATRRNTRKIPRPASPEPAQHSGPARILAPNSDTSGSQSQGYMNQPRLRRGVDEYVWTGEVIRTHEIMARTVGLRT